MHDIEPKRVTAAIIASVVPALTETDARPRAPRVRARSARRRHRIKTGMSILYENPREVGADRIVNAVAAYDRFKNGSSSSTSAPPPPSTA